MDELFSQSVRRRVFMQAAELTVDYEQAMLIIRKGGHWRIGEYDINTCELARQLGHDVYHWTGEEWRE